MATEHQLQQDVTILRQSLFEYPPLRTQPSSSPALIMLCGLPGTGKSHFARLLQEKYSVTVVGSDRSRKTLIANPEYTREEHQRVFAACHRLIEELLEENHRVVFDATNLNDTFRQPLLRIADRRGISPLIFWFTAPEAVIKQRLQSRSKGKDPADYSDADWNIYSFLQNGLEPIVDRHWVIDSSQPLDSAFRRVEESLKNGRQHKH